MELCVAINVKVFLTFFRLSNCPKVKWPQFLNCFNGSTNNTRTQLVRVFQDKKKNRNYLSPEWSKHMLEILLIGRKLTKNKPKDLEVMYHRAEEALTPNSFRRVSLKQKNHRDQSEANLSIKVNISQWQRKKRSPVWLKALSWIKKSLKSIAQ